jgi:hypothetical protein
MLHILSEESNFICGEVPFHAGAPVLLEGGLTPPANYTRIVMAFTGILYRFMSIKVVCQRDLADEWTARHPTPCSFVE